MEVEDAALFADRYKHAMIVMPNCQLTLSGDELNWAKIHLKAGVCIVLASGNKPQTISPSIALTASPTLNTSTDDEEGGGNRPTRRPTSVYTRIHGEGLSSKTTLSNVVIGFLVVTALLCVFAIVGLIQYVTKSTSSGRR